MIQVQTNPKNDYHYTKPTSPHPHLECRRQQQTHQQYQHRREDTGELCFASCAALYQCTRRCLCAAETREKRTKRERHPDCKQFLKKKKLMIDRDA